MTLRTRFASLSLALLAALALACSRDNDAAKAPVADPPVAAATTPATPESTSANVARSAPTAPAAAAQGATAPASAQPSADQAFAHVQKLAGELGVRVSGTPEEHAAAQYIAGQLRGYGYNVELQSFPVDAFVVRSTSFKLEDGRSLTAQPLTLSKPGTATGNLVYAGLGRPSDFSAAVRGQIALIERGELLFREKAANAVAAGATAVVVYNNQDEMFTGTLGESAPAIPVITISGADGKRLRDQVRAGSLRGTVSFDGGQTSSESFNVIGRWPDAPCRIIVGGHYDSVPAAPGASDNGTGTAAMLETARVSALQGNPQQACFVAFGSEEIGLVGSRRFVERMNAQERSALSYMLNLDMVAVGSEWLAIGSSDLQQQAIAAAKAIGVGMRATRLAGASSDHASFIDAGLPAVMLHRSDDPLLHTPEDVVGRVSPEQLLEAVRLSLAFLEQLHPA